MYKDARQIKPEELPDFDVLTAGFPCQSFSVAGKRRGFKDTRGTLFFEIAKIARVKRPTYLVLENVQGLLSNDKGRTFEIILQTLDELGYDAEWQVLNSKNFGVPQNRKRVFIVGHLRGKSQPKVFPIRKDEIVYYKTHAKTPTEGKWVWSSVNYCRTIDANYWKGGGRPLVVQWRRNHLRIFKNQSTTPALTANMGTGGYNMPLLLLENDVRKLTPLECFRLQGFPDDMITIAKQIGISDTQLYKMIGNAVTVPVVQTIARKIKKLHDSGSV